MKVGFIYTVFYPLTSSSSVHGYQLVKGLKEKGHEVLSLRKDANPLTTKFPKSVGGVMQFIQQSDLLYIRIDTHLWNDWFSMAKLFRPFRKLPVVWEINAPVEHIYSDYYPDIPSSIQRFVKKQTTKRNFLTNFCDAAICVSDVLKNYTIHELGITNSRTVPNGSDPELFKPAPRNENNPFHALLKDKFVVTWAGNAAFKWQGIQVITEVAEKIYNIDRDVVFLIISNKSVYDRVISPNIICLGEINYMKLPEFLNLADVGLCIYNHFDWSRIGFFNSPLKLYDYMAMELPTIGTKMGQIAQVIEDGKDGYLTNNDVDEIIGRILFLKSNPQVRKQMGTAARKKVVEHYNWNRVVNDTIQLFESLL